MIFTKCFNHTVENKEFLELLLTICSFIIAQWGVQIYSLMVFAASRIGNNYPPSLESIIQLNDIIMTFKFAMKLYT